MNSMSAEPGAFQFQDLEEATGNHMEHEKRYPSAEIKFSLEMNSMSAEARSEKKEGSGGGRKLLVKATNFTGIL